MLKTAQPLRYRLTLATPHPFTRKDYHAMIAAGILREDDPLELLNGQIIQNMPIGTAHAGMVNRLTQLLTERVGKRYIVAVQNPIALNEFSEPEPDIALLQPREDFYSNSHATPKEVALIIEVADTSLGFDREDKIPLYAMCGIPEVWLVDLPTKSVHVFRQPGAINYSEVLRLRNDDTVPVPGLPDTQLSVRELGL
jgi:Uma2 family endonuclease